MKAQPQILKQPAKRWRLPLAAVAVMYFLLLSATTARAQTVDDAGWWTAVFARGDLDLGACKSDRFRWWFDGHARFLEDADGFNQSIMRPGVGYALNDNAVIWAGYAWIRTSPVGGSDFNENRIWQQLTWTKDVHPVTIGFRSRLEQRFVERGSDTGWRFRQFFSARRPLGNSSKLLLVTWDEAFFNLNDANFGVTRGFDQNRIFAGIGWKFDPTDRWRVEIGYMNQFIRNSGGNDTSNHVLGVNFYRNP